MLVERAETGGVDLSARTVIDCATAKNTVRIILTQVIWSLPVVLRLSLTA